MRPSLPAIGGLEGVGEVYTVGPRVKLLSPGDWVIPSPLSSGKLLNSIHLNVKGFLISKKQHRHNFKRIFFWRLGTWQTYVVKEESAWHRIDKRCPIEYAATITVNPLTALRMLEDFVDLKPGSTLLILHLSKSKDHII